MNRLGLFIVFIFTSLVWTPTLLSQDEAPNATIKVLVGKRTFVGKVIAVDNELMVLLRRNGRMTMIPKKKIEAARTVAKGFTSQKADEIREQLMREFGNKYQVSITNHFVVVHPPGNFKTWALPFEKLYLRYQNYFASRGFNLDEPTFPMVAVVLKSRGEFDRFLESYHEANENVLGYYSPRSNRIISYDQTGGMAKDENWFFTADTIVHEATHQSAFNTGLHTRFAPNPRWISEGLATMFEAPGVQNSMYYSKRADRINYGRLDNLRTMYEKDYVTDRMMASMIGSDDIFRVNPGGAYALAWGLTFYLAECEPEQYSAFLRADGRREDFHNYEGRDRLTDFIRKFGKISELRPRMERFIMALPTAGIDKLKKAEAAEKARLEAEENSETQIADASNETSETPAEPKDETPKSQAQTALKD
jgi:hypothetical protein